MQYSMDRIVIVYVRFEALFAICNYS